MDNYAFSGDNLIPPGLVQVSNGTNFSFFKSCLIKNNAPSGIDFNNLANTRAKELGGVLKQPGISMKYIPGWEKITGTYSLSYHEVTMPDAKLKAAVNAAMNSEKINGKTNRAVTDKVYKEELEQLNKLSVGDGLANLQGIEYATSLTYLDLPRSELTDVSKLASLTKLTYLSLWDSPKLKTLGNLKLPELTELYITNSEVQDISVLKNSPKLKEVVLSNNRISDFTPLKGVVNQLTKLEATGQQLSGAVQKLSGPVAVLGPVTLTLPDGTKGTLKSISDSGVYDQATGKLTIPWTSAQTKDVTYSYNELSGKITASVTQPVEFVYAAGIWEEGYFITYPKQIPLTDKYSKKNFHINMFNMSGNMNPYDGVENVRVRIDSQNNFKLINKNNPSVNSLPYEVTLDNITQGSNSKIDVILSANKNTVLGEVKSLERGSDQNVYGDTWKISIE